MPAQTQNFPQYDPRLFTTDEAFKLIDPVGTPLCQDVWNDKYRWEGESYEEMMARVVNGVCAMDKDPGAAEYRATMITAMRNNLWMPAGRILSGAGTPKRVTLLNCFVNAELEDDMESIARALGNTMLTMQQGGGIGTDFSPLRPPGAVLRRTGSTAPGPGPFIDTFDSACTTIRSAGDRRGAEMATLHCSHPFLPEFIQAKHTKGRWTNFNVSVLITDAFMAAVAEDEEWYLHHPVPPAFDRNGMEARDFTDNSGDKQYVYAIYPARQLWDMIMRSTYEFAEPGVIYIDRVNDMNNLGYCETISCTNPCGEQPLPPHGCCDLGAIQLSRMVLDPFTEDAIGTGLDLDLLRRTVALGVRFLDNVIDVTNYPLPEQRTEQFAKRRIGLGMGGLADALHMQGVRYGSARSVRMTEDYARETCFASYRASIELAKIRGPFPLFDREKFLDRPFIKTLPEDIQQGIAEHGIRNGVLNTIAPMGTTSIAVGNNSSGLEPVFAHSQKRKVRQVNDTWESYTEVAYGARLWLALNPGSTLEDLPVHMNVCSDVRVHEHIRIQEVCQRWVDASISKTINLDPEIAYEAFKDVYQQAYDAECKGCTTYRPSDVRGSILDVGGDGDDAIAGQEAETQKVGLASKAQRPEILDSRTVKISALYMTVGYVDGVPYEVFLNSKDQKALEWTMALSILMSMCLRQGIEVEALATEFQQVAALEGGWAENGDNKQHYWPSLVAYIGFKLKQLASHPLTLEFPEETIYTVSLAEPDSSLGSKSPQGPQGPQKIRKVCPSCKVGEVINEVGCDTCKQCGYWSTIPVGKDLS